jgi:hypothetical protein
MTARKPNFLYVCKMIAIVGVLPLILSQRFPASRLRAWHFTTLQTKRYFFMRRSIPEIGREPHPMFI